MLLNFAIFSVYLDDIVGYVFVLFILTVAATESSIGLSILSAYYKLKQTIQMDSFSTSFVFFLARHLYSF